MRIPAVKSAVLADKQADHTEIYWLAGHRGVDETFEMSEAVSQMLLLRDCLQNFELGTFAGKKALHFFDVSPCDRCYHLLNPFINALRQHKPTKILGDQKSTHLLFEFIFLLEPKPIADLPRPSNLEEHKNSSDLQEFSSMVCTDYNVEYCHLCTPDLFREGFPSGHES